MDEAALIKQINKCAREVKICEFMFDSLGNEVRCKCYAKELRRDNERLWVVHYIFNGRELTRNSIEKYGYISLLDEMMSEVVRIHKQLNDKGLNVKIIKY